MKKNVLALSIAAMMDGFAGRQEDVFYGVSPADFWTRYLWPCSRLQPTHSAYMQVTHQGDHK